MSAVEFVEWIAYFRIEPIPDPIRDAAQICATIANVNRSKGPAYRARDFMPRVVGAKQTTEEMMKAWGIS